MLIFSSLNLQLGAGNFSFSEELNIFEQNFKGGGHSIYGADHTGLYLAAALAFVVALMPSSAWLPAIGKIGMVFLPVFQMAAVILGWNFGHFLLLGDWPTAGG